MDRRVRRTQEALRKAFIALVLERGYENLSVEDITERADVARATFYSHYSDKEALLTSLFQDLVDELIARIAEVPVDPSLAHADKVLLQVYRHAAEMPDLYRVCLGKSGSALAREAYVTTVAKATETRFAERVRMAGASPRVPVELQARAFAGLHTALLADWLERGRPVPIEAMVMIETRLVVHGFAWASGMEADATTEEEMTGTEG